MDRVLPVRVVFGRSPAGDLQALLDGRVAKVVPPGTWLHREQRQFHHESLSVCERAPAQRAAARDDQIGGCGDRRSPYPGIKRVCACREQVQQRRVQSAVAKHRIQGLSNPVAVGDRPVVDGRRDGCPRLDNRGHRVAVLVQNAPANLSHVPQSRHATDKSGVQAGGLSTPDSEHST